LSITEAVANTKAELDALRQHSDWPTAVGLMERIGPMLDGQTHETAIMALVGTLGRTLRAQAGAGPDAAMLGAVATLVDQMWRQAQLAAAPRN